MAMPKKTREPTKLAETHQLVLQVRPRGRFVFSRTSGYVTTVATALAKAPKVNASVHDTVRMPTHRARTSKIAPYSMLWYVGALPAPG